MPNPFHLAIPVADLARATRFYVEVLGCTPGRADTLWQDLDFFGHQLVLHQVAERRPLAGHNAVDGHQVPVPHFGVVLPWEAWHRLTARLEGRVPWTIPPHIRMRGQPGEQATCFFLDPDGNALEFKAFQDPSRLFAT